MLEHFFQCEFVCRLLQEDPSRVDLEAFTAYLWDRGHLPAVARQYINAAGHYLRWMRLRRTGDPNVNQATIERFLNRHLPRCRCAPPSPRQRILVRAALSNFLNCRNKEGGRPAKTHDKNNLPCTVINAFDRYMQSVCGLASGTRRGRRRYASEFLHQVFGTGTIHWGRLKPEYILSFVAEFARRCSPATAQVNAAHIHRPAGGQGMNTGIGDAVNLAWKLATVVQGRASESILDSYEPERIGFAHSLVATTDRLFQGMVGKSIGAEMFRNLLLPHVLPWLLGLSSFRAAQFKLVSQIQIHYPESSLSAGAAGAIHGGDLLPWVEGLDNFAPLTSLGWQFHVYGKPSQTVARLAQHRQLPLHSFGWSEACGNAGLQWNACYLVRPDGYVSAAGTSDDIGHAESILDAFRIAPKQ